MIELVFVIVVLGILAAIAIPKFAATRDDAQIAKARATIAAVQSGIVNERQKRLFRGDNTWITKLNYQTSTIFDSNVSGGEQILMYPVSTSSEKGHWSIVTEGSVYRFNLGNYSANFTYDNTDGTFTCTSGACGLY